MIALSKLSGCYGLYQVLCKVMGSDSPYCVRAALLFGEVSQFFQIPFVCLHSSGSAGLGRPCFAWGWQAVCKTA